MVQKIISIEINAFDLVGRKYKVCDNSYILNTRTHQSEQLYGKIFTIISLPYSESIPSPVDKDKQLLKTFILVEDTNTRDVYRVLFLDRGIVL